MSRKWFLLHAVLLVVVTGVVVVSGTAAVGSHIVAGQHSATQSKTEATAPGWELRSGVTNTALPMSDNGWSMSRANAANTNYINTTGPTNPITARWTFTSDANTFSAGPLVTNGTTYFATRYYTTQKGEPDGNLYAVDAWTGEVRWTFATSSGGYPNKIAVLRDTVYFGGSDGDVYALDVATGDEFWSFRTTGKIRDLKVANRTLYAVDRKTLYALGALRGEAKWRFKAVGGGRPTGVAVKEGTIYLSTKIGHLYALDSETGTVDWHVENGPNYPPSPVVANGIVYRKGSNHLRALDAETGEELWTRPGGPAPAVLGNTVYFTANNSLLAVDARTGTDRWSSRGRGARTIPVLLDDIGYTRKGGSDGALYTLNPATGEYHARFSPPPFNNSWDRWRSGTAVLNGSVYAGVGIDEPNTRLRSDRTIFYALGTPEFNYTNLSIRPQSPAVNETMTATVTVRNTGTGPGTVNTTLAVNGNITNATTANLDPRTNETVTLTHRFQQNGTYTVGIANLTRRIVVGDVEVAPTPTPTFQADSESPTQTPPPEETATAADSDITPTATSGTARGFGVGVSVLGVAMVVVVLSRRLWN